ncbi:unnamed protein product [Symbiodinium sp. CCMP2592]|nr:unnamed protein product [Symbiodinium sp. CCMP2592]
MQGVRYFRTFIDVEDEEPTIPGPPRAQSCPPFGTITEKLDEDVAIYVSSLSDRASELTQAPAQVAPLPVLSQGSRGHPDLCNRPCIFFASGSCHLGSTCGHCHLAHPQRAARLDKRQRVAVQALSERTLLSLLLPHFRTHAGPAQGLILMLEEASASAEMDQEEDTDVSQLSRKLESVLSRMSLASLVGLIASRSFENGLSMRVQAELDRLRSAAA